jgi:hypothetical protein
VKKLCLTRTIKVSCLSCFLHDSEPLIKDSQSIWHPDTRSCPQSKSFTMTTFCLRDNLYHDTALVVFFNFIYRDYFPATYNNCTAITPTPNKNCTWLAKSTPYLSCHRDYFPAKVPGPLAGWLRQVTQPPFIAGPLAVRFEQNILKKQRENLDNYNISTYLCDTILT